MKTTRALRAGAAIVAALACLFAMAAPASATVHTYSVTMESGRIRVNTLNFDTPGSGATTCTPPAVGTTTINGTINDVTNVVTGTLTIVSFFTMPWPFTGNYALVATGSGTTGTYTGGTTGTFSSLTMALTFTIRNIAGSGTSCTPGTTVVCSGNASLHASGGFYNGANLPLTGSENLYVNATGNIGTVGTCAFPFSAFVTMGATLSLADNPNDDFGPDTDADGDHDPDTVPDGGAIFHQVP